MSSKCNIPTINLADFLPVIPPIPSFPPLPQVPSFSLEIPLSCPLDDTEEDEG